MIIIEMPDISEPWTRREKNVPSQKPAEICRHGHSAFWAHGEVRKYDQGWMARWKWRKKYFKMEDQHIKKWVKWSILLFESIQVLEDASAVLVEGVIVDVRDLR